MCCRAGQQKHMFGHEHEGYQDQNEILRMQLQLWQVTVSKGRSSAAAYDAHQLVSSSGLPFRWRTDLQRQRIVMARQCRMSRQLTTEVVSRRLPFHAVAAASLD